MGKISVHQLVTHHWPYLNANFGIYTEFPDQIYVHWMTENWCSYHFAILRNCLGQVHRGAGVVPSHYPWRRENDSKLRWWMNFATWGLGSQWMILVSAGLETREIDLISEGFGSTLQDPKDLDDLGFETEKYFDPVSLEFLKMSREFSQNKLGSPHEIPK